jgi:Tol biopolymer transport system component
VPVLGGNPQLWLPNAAALSWIDNQRLLFSEIKRGDHMAIVTASESRADTRDVYVPASENGMAHRSYLSSDGKSVLVVEMDEHTNWSPCRVVPLDGSSAGRRVGPPGAACTAAAWSPDGKWMYLTADTGSNDHIWRQRFPDGEPQQITSGPTEEDGIAVSQDGRFFITAVGLRQRPIWLHDSSGDHQVSLEGYAYFPRLYLAGKKLCYLNGKGQLRSDAASEVWLADLESGTSARVLPGLLVSTYAISQDGRVVASVRDKEGNLGLWLAPLDRRSPPRAIPFAFGDWPLFGPNREIFYVAEENNVSFIFRVHEDGSGRARVSAEPVSELHSVSPDGKWVAAYGQSSSEGGSFEFAYPTAGGQRVPLCNPPCRVSWAPDGRFMYFSVASGYMSLGATGRTYVLPTRPGSMFPEIPAGGFRSPDQLAAAPGVRIIDAADLSPGPSPDVYAFSREVVQRNLYRIPLK